MWWYYFFVDVVCCVVFLMVNVSVIMCYSVWRTHSRLTHRVQRVGRVSFGLPHAAITSSHSRAILKDNNRTHVNSILKHSGTY